MSLMYLWIILLTKGGREGGSKPRKVVEISLKSVVRGWGRGSCQEGNWLTAVVADIGSLGIVIIHA